MVTLASRLAELRQQRATGSSPPQSSIAVRWPPTGPLRCAVLMAMIEARLRPLPAASDVFRAAIL